MAVQNVFGGDIVWHSEINEGASAVLAHHYPHTPNLGDITTIQWGEVEQVDVLCAGFPCQDVSVAGTRAGMKPGTRTGLWSYVHAAIEQLRPAYVVLENVKGLLSARANRTVESGTPNLGGDPPDGLILRAIGAVCSSLGEIGYDTQFETLPASDVGAPHRRERVFILATDSRHPRPAVHLDYYLSAIEPVTSGVLLPTPRTTDSQGAGMHGRGGLDLKTALSLLPADGGWGKYFAAIRRWESLTRPAPEPTESNSNGKPRLTAAFGEWMMGWPAGWVTEEEIPISHVGQIKVIGNGVVPQQAQAALGKLLAISELYPT